MSATDKPLLDAPSLSPTGAQAAAVPPVSATAPSISAAPAAARTAEPISPTSSNSLVSDTELEAALAEIEKLCTSRPDESEPAASTVASGSDEDDLDPRSQPDDAPPLTPEAPAVADARTDADALQAPPDVVESTAAAEAPPAPEAAAAPPAKKIRFKIGRGEGTPAELPAEPAPGPIRPTPPAGNPLAAADPPEPPQMPVATPGKRVYRMVDSALDAANRPFVLLSGRVRDTIGAVAVATILVSILMPMLLNYMSPKRDPVSFLRQKRIEFERGPELRAEQAAHAGGNDATHAAPAPAAGSHGKSGGGQGKTGGGHH